MQLLTAYIIVGLILECHQMVLSVLFAAKLSNTGEQRTHEDTFHLFLSICIQEKRSYLEVKLACVAWITFLKPTILFLVAAAATGLKQSPGQMTSGMTIEASCFRETGQAEQVMDWKELSNDTAALYRNQNFKSFLWKHRMLTGQWEMWIDLVMSCRTGLVCSGLHLLLINSRCWRDNPCSILSMWTSLLERWAQTHLANCLCPTWGYERGYWTIQGSFREKVSRGDGACSGVQWSKSQRCTRRTQG